MNKKIHFMYVYLITNIVLNKQYIGSHICYKDNINKDLYFGSSVYLNEDVLIFGKDNFFRMQTYRKNKIKI